jgi:hypothetical protein
MGQIECLRRGLCGCAVARQRVWGLLPGTCGADSAQRVVAANVARPLGEELPIEGMVTWLSNLHVADW